MTKRVISLLVFLLIYGCVWDYPFQQAQNESWERAYAEGRDNFYDSLKEMASYMELEHADRTRLSDAQKKTPGLYEHLMNFYYFTTPRDQGKTDASGHVSILAEKMAKEFMGSLPAQRLKKDISPLESILLSVGFRARKASPQFRKFLRSMTRLPHSHWALKELEVRQAHEIAKGEGIRLAIIDTGVDPTIKEIKSQIVGWKNFLDRSNPQGDGGKFPYDWGGHGTSIASVVSQIAPEADIMIVKVFDQETMFHAPFTRWNLYLIAAGINWAAQNGADIISLSVAMKLNYKEIRDACKNCWEHNIALISAAGNVGEESPEHQPYYPASYPWSIGVGGAARVGGRLKVWEHSSKGYFIDIVAPAAEILVESPSYLDRRAWPTRVSGNSLAVPIVAATSSLILSAMQTEQRRVLKRNPGDLVETVRGILKMTSSNKKLGYSEPNPESGFGLINAHKAVRKARIFK
jgi:major intracellular serine protease